MRNNQKHSQSWAIGGGTMLGVGVGFIILPHSMIGFIGSIIAGIGLGLIVSSAYS